MDIAYAAHTESCTLLLDERGICRKVVVRPAAALLHARGALDPGAERCLGAQYVASIDLESYGGLIAAPRAGTPMLFAYVDATGRICLVRTGPITRFEDKRPAKAESEIRAIKDANLPHLDAPHAPDVPESEDKTHPFLGLEPTQTMFRNPMPKANAPKSQPEPYVSRGIRTPLPTPLPSRPGPLPPPPAAPASVPPPPASSKRWPPVHDKNAPTLETEYPTLPMTARTLRRK
jgi:hypothetical protein